jgi:putative spermidine/putrescine transport system ATP-binding protein
VYVTHDQEEALSLPDTIVVMSEGRVEQIGSPAEVYGAPATPFVARFVGQLSVLTGRVVDATEGRLAIGRQELDLGRPLDGHADGSSVTLSIRPEAIEIATPQGARPRLTGTIRDLQFLGPVIRTRLILDGEGGDLLFDVFNRPGMVPPEPGQAVTVAIPADSVMVVGAGEVTPDASVVDEEAG